MREHRHTGREPHHHQKHESPPPWIRHWLRGGWGGPPPWAGPRRARRGDVRAAVLALLVERPMHGYDLIQGLEERSGGMWRPSPGSIYPTLQMLEDEGLVTSEERDGKKAYSLTDLGRAEVEARKERSGGTAPWDFASGGPEEFVRLRDTVFQLGAAAMQVARTGSGEQVARAADVLTETRKRLYAILAED